MRFHGIYWLKLINTPIKLKIVMFLCKNKADLSEREIASIVKVSHMSVNRLLRELSRVNFVHSVFIGGSHVWRVNRLSYAFKILVSLIEQQALSGDPLDDLKTVILEKLPRDLVIKIILFGSLAKQSGRDDSDIDLFVMVKNENSKVLIEKWLERLSTMCLERYGNRFAPYVLTYGEFIQRKNLDLVKNIEKGIEIYSSSQEQ